MPRDSAERNLGFMADSVTVAPDVYSVMSENNRVRVLQIKTKPGQGSELHSHPDAVLVAVTDCDWKLTVEGQEPVDIHVKAGDSMFLDAVSHTALDISQNGSHAIAVELK